MTGTEIYTLLAYGYHNQSVRTIEGSSHLNNHSSDYTCPLGGQNLSWQLRRGWNMAEGLTAPLHSVSWDAEQQSDCENPQHPQLFCTKCTSATRYIFHQFKAIRPLKDGQQLLHLTSWSACKHLIMQKLRTINKQFEFKKICPLGS